MGRLRFLDSVGEGQDAVKVKTWVRYAGLTSETPPRGGDINSREFFWNSLSLRVAPDPMRFREQFNP